MWTIHLRNHDKLGRSRSCYKSRQLILRVSFSCISLEEKSFTLSVSARTPPATGVVPVQEQLVWGLGRAWVWHSDYRWFSGWGKLWFRAAYVRNPLWASPFFEVEPDWIICHGEEVSRSHDCHLEIHLSSAAAWTGLSWGLQMKGRYWI